MIILKIIGILLLVIVVLLLIAILRTLIFIPRKYSNYVPKNEPEREEEYAHKLSKMVQYETVSIKDVDQREKFLGFHKVLEKQFPLLFKNLEKTEIDGNLLFKWKGLKSDKPIVLMSHQDVVPAKASEWMKDPYSGDIENGKVYGRGTADIKCGVMSFMQAVEELLDEGYTPEQDIYLSSSCTEEVGGKGCPALVNEMKKRGVKPWLVIDEGGAIVEEPIGGCKGKYAMIGVVEKGMGDLKIIARSKGGHSSTPGPNTPLERLAAFINDISKHNPLKKEFIPQATAMFETMAPYGPFYLRLLFGNLWLFKPLLKKILGKISPTAGALITTTIAFTMCEGSSASNVIPSVASVTANMRYAPHQGMKESNEIITKVAKKYNLETELVSGYDYCPPVDTNSDAFKYVEETVNKVFPGLPTCPYVMTGGTDAKFYSEICDACIRFSPVIFGPEQFNGMHGIDECIDTVSLPGAVDFYKTIIKDAK